MPKQTVARARVRVTLEFSLSQPWGRDCTLAQVYEQATREIEVVLDRKVREAKIVGQPQIEAIICEER